MLIVQKIKRALGLAKPPTLETVTLLVIGPPSCGKTALIYFLLRFAKMKLRGKNGTVPNEDWFKKSASVADESNSDTSSGLDSGQQGLLGGNKDKKPQERIREMSWADFSYKISEETTQTMNIT